MNDNLVTFPSGELRQCEECGADAVRMSFKDERFVYGSGSEAVTLTARVPVWTCQECGEAYTDGTAEEIRHETVCRYLGVLSPKEVRAIRERFGMTQSEFAKVTRFGLASVKRWETGARIQNQSSDRFLRLLEMDGSIMDKLRVLERGQEIRPADTGRIFRTVISAEVRAQAETFNLRPMSM